MTHSIHQTLEYNFKNLNKRKKLINVNSLYLTFPIDNAQYKKNHSVQIVKITNAHFQFRRIKRDKSALDIGLMYKIVLITLLR